MANKVRIDVDDRQLKELLRQLRKARDAGLDEQLKRTHADGAEIVARRAAQLAPRKSGALAGDIRGSGAKRSARVRAGRAALPYAGPIHYGWPERNIEEQPFIADAVSDKAGEVAKMFRDNIDKMLRKVAARRYT